MNSKLQKQHGLTLCSAILVILAMSNVGVAQKGKKPPKDDPPPNLPSYSIEFLGTFGSPLNEAVNMNDLGDVLMRNLDTNEYFIAFYNSGVTYQLDDLIRAEDLDKYRTPLSAAAINNYGQLCAWVRDKSTNDILGTARISLQFDGKGDPIPDAGIVEVVAPEGDIEVSDINDLGDIVGVSSQGPFLFTDVDGIRSLSPGEWGGGYPVVNNFSEVATFVIHNVGAERTENRAVLYQPPNYEIQILGVLDELNDPFLTSQSYARDVNDLGIVVGNSTAPKKKGHFQTHAFRTTPNGLESIGTLGGAWSNAVGINNDGAIVGMSDDRNGVRLSFLYTDELGMIDLAPLITNLPAGVRIYAENINEMGQISGQAVISGVSSEAFLLTPTN